MKNLVLLCLAISLLTACKDKQKTTSLINPPAPANPVSGTDPAPLSPAPVTPSPVDPADPAPTATPDDPAPVSTLPSGMNVVENPRTEKTDILEYVTLSKDGKFAIISRKEADDSYEAKMRRTLQIEHLESGKIVYEAKLNSQTLLTCPQNLLPVI